MSLTLYVAEDETVTYERIKENIPTGVTVYDIDHLVHPKSIEKTICLLKNVKMDYAIISSNPIVLDLFTIEECTIVGKNKVCPATIIPLIKTSINIGFKLGQLFVDEQLKMS